MKVAAMVEVTTKNDEATREAAQEVAGIVADQLEEALRDLPWVLDVDVRPEVLL